MEDPWGSPWATTDDHNDHKAANAFDPEPPPPAFFSINNHNNDSLPAISSQLPWGDDDSFGGWASSELSQPAPSASGGAWGLNDTAKGDGGQLTPGFEPKRKSGTSQWPSSRSTSPGYTHGSSSRQPSVDHFSLDPWASEPASERKHVSAIPTLSPPLLQLPVLPTAAAIDGHLTTSSPPRTSALPTDNRSPALAPASTAKSYSDNATVTENKSTTQYLKIELTGSPTISGAVDDDAQHVPRDDSVVTVIEDTGTSSDGGDIIRKISKVQELVYMYDGISRRNSPTPQPMSTSRSVSQERTAPLEDFGAETTVVQAEHDADQQAGHSSDSIGEFGGTDSSDDERLKMSTVNLTPLPDLPPRKIVAALATDINGLSDFTKGSTGHKSFHVDLARLNDLYSCAQSRVTGADVEIPDHVITDSFESISERKVWHRVSRYGPMRKHHAGGDDSYGRTTWLDSSMRPEVIKTVRRWMEEDSMGARPYRKGANSGIGAHAFGWGDSTAPVDFDTVFGRPKSVNAHPGLHTGQFSTEALPLEGHHTAEARPLSMPPQTALETSTWNLPVDFGWNSETKVATAPKSGTILHPITQSRMASKRPSPLSLDRHSARETHMLPLSNVLATAASVSAQETNDEEDDDEWGEMVGTPSLDSFSAPTGYIDELPKSDNFLKDMRREEKEDPFNDTRPSCEAPNAVGNTAITQKSGPPLTSEYSDSHTLQTNEEVKVPAHSKLPSPKGISSSVSKLGDKSVGTDENDLNIARSIIRSLPNFAYMLR